MKNNSDSKLLLGISIFLVIFTILPIIAPIAAHFNLQIISDPIYWIYQWFCHQRPWRSYHLFDYQLAMDARMMLMFGSMAISSIVIYKTRLNPLKPRYAIILALIMIFPLGLDGIVQMFAEIQSSNIGALPIYESTNLIRSLTGTILGIGVAFALFPYLNSEVYAESAKLYIKPIFYSFVLSIVFIMVMVFAWYKTSVIYKPTNMLFDSGQRFPGYNYEITTSAGHSTIERVIKTNDIEKFSSRAKYFDRDDLLDEYNSKN